MHCEGEPELRGSKIIVISDRDATISIWVNSILQIYVDRHKIHACVMNCKALIVYESQVLGTYYKFHNMLTGTH